MELTTEIMDLEITIKYTAYKAEPMTRHYPGDPAYLEWDITHICGINLDSMAKIFGYDSMATLQDWIIDREGFRDEAEQVCWDGVEESKFESAVCEAEHQMDCRENR